MLEMQCTSGNVYEAIYEEVRRDEDAVTSGNVYEAIFAKVRRVGDGGKVDERQTEYGDCAGV